MQCPVCGKQMDRYKEEPSYSSRKQVEYKRTFYRCEQDDTWATLEVPVGPLKEFDAQRAPVVTQP